MSGVDVGLTSLFVAAVLSAASPFLAAFLRPFRVPQVVILIVGGIVVGPQVTGWADPSSINLIANVGLAFLFLLAGYELQLDLFRQRAGRLAVTGWLTAAAISLVVTGALVAAGFVHDFIPVALGLTTTAIGTLLPILRDHDMLAGNFGGFIMSAGAAGEFLPLVGIAVFLGSKGRIYGLVSLVGMAVVALALAWLPRLARLDRFAAVSQAGEDDTSQTTLRLTIMLLFALLVFAAHFGLDVVLGAFLAGVVLHRWAPGDVAALERKLDAVGYGFFIPVFFVYSGMGLNIDSIREAPLRLLTCFALLLLVRGLPSLLLYRRDLSLVQRTQMMLLTATALPVLVALAQIGLSTGNMLPENAAALVGAGVLSVLIFPGLAVALNTRAGSSKPEAAPTP